MVSFLTQTGYLQPMYIKQKQNILVAECPAFARLPVADCYFFFLTGEL